MAKKNFLLLSLNDSKAKKISNIIGNESCKKILDYLADHEGTETEIATALNIPLSTTHYNLEQLKKAGLVDAEEFHYSEKGKEVYHYTLANKYIIIAPKNTKGLIGKLKGILPMVGLLAGMGAVANLSRYFIPSTTAEMVAIPAMAASRSAPAPEAMIEESAVADAVMAEQLQMVESTALSTPELALTWLSIGLFIAAITIIIVQLLKKD